MREKRSTAIATLFVFSGSSQHSPRTRRSTSTFSARRPGQRRRHADQVRGTPFATPSRAAQRRRRDEPRSSAGRALVRLVDGLHLTHNRITVSSPLAAGRVRAADEPSVEDRSSPARTSTRSCAAPTRLGLGEPLVDNQDGRASGCAAGPAARAATASRPRVDCSTAATDGDLQTDAAGPATGRHRHDERRPDGRLRRPARARREQPLHLLDRDAATTSGVEQAGHLPLRRRRRHRPRPGPPARRSPLPRRTLARLRDRSTRPATAPTPTTT